MRIEERITGLRDALVLLPGVLRQLDSLESLLPKLEALGPVLDRIGGLDERVGDLAIIEQAAPRLESLDNALERLHSLGQKEPKALMAQEKPMANTVNHDLERLKMLSKFAALVGKAKEIEQEWQKIQQDEHDSFFAFQVMRGSNEREYAYKKGIADGIKWVINRFS